MKCPCCGEEVNRTSIRYINDTKIESCKHCEPSVSHYPIYDSTMGFSISVAHRDDIRARYVDVKSGEVTRR